MDEKGLLNLNIILYPLFPGEKRIVGAVSVCVKDRTPMVIEISNFPWILNIFNFIFIVCTVTDIPISPDLPTFPSQSPPPFPLAITTLLSVSMGHADPFGFLHPVPTVTTLFYSQRVSGSSNHLDLPTF